MKFQIRNSVVTLTMILSFILGQTAPALAADEGSIFHANAELQLLEDLIVFSDGNAEGAIPKDVAERQVSEIYQRYLRHPDYVPEQRMENLYTAAKLMGIETDELRGAIQKTQNDLQEGKITTPEQFRTRIMDLSKNIRVHRGAQYSSPEDGSLHVAAAAAMGLAVLGTWTIVSVLGDVAHGRNINFKGALDGGTVAGGVMFLLLMVSG